MVIPNRDDLYQFGFYCNSSLTENNLFYNVVCKYRQNPNEPKILPKRPQVARKTCLTRVDNTSGPLLGVSENSLRIDLPAENQSIQKFDVTGAWDYMGYSL